MDTSSPRRAIAALCTGLAVAVPAVPADAAGNLTCGIQGGADAGSTDPNALVVSFTGGPWQRAGSAVYLRCDVVTEDYYVARAEGWAENVAKVKETLWFVAAPGSMTLCTRFAYDDGAFTTVDMDAVTPGVQCAAVTDTGTGAARAVSVPQALVIG